MKVSQRRDEYIDSQLYIRKFYLELYELIKQESIIAITSTYSRALASHVFQFMSSSVCYTMLQF